MCPLRAQPWLSAEQSDVLGGGFDFFRTPLFGRRHGPINCRGRNTGVKQAPHQATESGPWESE